MVKIGYKVLLAADVWTYTPRNLTNPASASDLNNMLVGISGTATGRAAKLDEITSARMSELDSVNMPADIDTIKARVLDKVPYTTKEILCYPLAAAGAYATSSTTAWAWGSWAELVPANTITSDFIILGIYVHIEKKLATYHFQVQIGKGSAGAETSIATVAGHWYYASTAGFAVRKRYFPLPIPIKVSANERIAVRVTDEAAAAYAYRVSINYIELPL